VRDRAEIAGEHRRAPDVGDRNARGGGDRLDHHAFEGALPQLADEQPHEEILLGKLGVASRGQTAAWYHAQRPPIQG